MGTASLNTVAFILGSLGYGGAERQAIELARRLPAHGWRVVFLLAEKRGELIPLAEELGAPVYGLGAEFSRSKVSPKFWLNLGTTIRRARAMMRKENCLIAQSFLFWEEIITVPAGVLSGPVKGIITSRRNAGMFKEKHLHYRLLDRVLEPFVDVIVCNSKHVREVNLAREKIKPGKMRVIYNGVDYDRFAEAAPVSIAREFPQLANAAPLILLVGALKREKRQDIFLEAMAKLRRSCPGAKALIVGPDLGMREEMERLIEHHDLSDVVLLAGARANPENYLAACDLFVLTSENEGFPNVVLEAMAAAKPIVSTLVSGAREAILPNETGFLVPVNDSAAVAEAIASLAADAGRATAFGRAGQARVREHFSTEAMVMKYAELYAELVAGK